MKPVKYAPLPFSDDVEMGSGHFPYKQGTLFSHSTNSRDFIDRLASGERDVIRADGGDPGLYLSGPQHISPITGKPRYTIRFRLLRDQNFTETRSIKRGDLPGSAVDSCLVSPPRFPEPQVFVGANVFDATLEYVTYIDNHRWCCCCYITTAVCQTLGLPDNCEELITLRRFRDEVLLLSDQGRADVAHYYAIAPAIVQSIDQRPDAAEIYTDVYVRFIQPAIEALNCGNTDSAYALYKKMVENTQALGRVSH